jgi:hypothetical protein
VRRLTRKCEMFDRAACGRCCSAWCWQRCCKHLQSQMSRCCGYIVYSMML